MTLTPWTLIAVRAAMVPKQKTSSELDPGGRGGGLPQGTRSQPSSFCGGLHGRWGKLDRELGGDGMCASVTAPGASNWGSMARPCVGPEVGGG